MSGFPAALLMRGMGAALALLITAVARPLQSEAAILYLAFQVPSTFAGTVFKYGDIVKYDTETGASSLFFDASEQFVRGHLGGGIDALEILSDGTLLLSTVDRAQLPGVGRFDRNDIVHYDPVNHTGSIVFDAADHFRNRTGDFTNHGNIDVIDLLSDGSFLLSTQQAANWDGLAVDGDDIFRYDPITGMVSLFFDGDILRDGRMDINIDAFDVMPDGRYLLSIFKKRKLINDLTPNGGDLLTYDPTTGDLEIYLARDDITDWRGKHRNIRAVDVEHNGEPIPEPMSMVLFGMGAAAVAWKKRWNRKR